MDLQKSKVPDVPPSVYYIPEFISLEEEERIIKEVNSAPLPKWTQLSHRRLQNWGGIPHLKGMIAEKLPIWLEEFVTRIDKLEVFPTGKSPNHVLVNEYCAGQGIMPHTDGPLFHPIVTTISCGSSTLLDFFSEVNESESTNKVLCTFDGNQVRREKCFSLLLERRSLVILQDQVYHDYLHAIAEVSKDTISHNLVKNIHLCCENYTEGQVVERGTRISLTIRHVPKTTKSKIQLCR